MNPPESGARLQSGTGPASLERTLWTPARRGLIWTLGLGAFGLAFAKHSWYYALIFPVAIAGGAVMTQAWALLFTLMPNRHRGAIRSLRR